MATFLVLNLTECLSRWILWIDLIGKRRMEAERGWTGAEGILLRDGAGCILWWHAEIAPGREEDGGWTQQRYHQDKKRGWWK